MARASAQGAAAGLLRRAVRDDRSIVTNSGRRRKTRAAFRNRAEQLTLENADYRRSDMCRAMFALTVLAIASGTSAALADDSDHASMNSLKSEIQHQMRHMHRYTGLLPPRYAAAISNRSGCSADFGAYGCIYWAQ